MLTSGPALTGGLGFIVTSVEEIQIFPLASVTVKLKVWVPGASEDIPVIFWPLAI